VSHHKDFARIDTLYPASDYSDDDPLDPVVAVVGDIADMAVAVLGEFIRSELPAWIKKARLPILEVIPTVPVDPVADFRKHAAARIRQALDEYRRLFYFLERQECSSTSNLAAIALRGVVLLADHTASAHVVPPPNASLDLPEMLERLGLTSKRLHRHQELAARTAGNALLAA